MVNQISSDEHGEIIEEPLALETYDRLEEPKNYSPEGTDYDKVQTWRGRINVARKIRDDNLRNLKRYIDFYEGIQWHNDDPEIPILTDRATINLIFSNIKKELPYLYFQNPSPIINATRNEFELGAFALQELLRNYAKYNLKTELKKHVRLAILDAKFSIGCLKVSYTPTFGSNPNVGKPILIGRLQNNYPVFLTDEDTGELIFENDKILLSELYYIERISPRELLIDSTCRNFIERAGWIGQDIVKPLKYLKDHPLYKNTDRLTKNVEWDEIFKNLDRKSEDVQALKELYGNEDTELVRFVEIYDKKNNKLLCLPDNCDWFIREETLETGDPYCILKFNEKPDHFYPVSDIAQEIPLQREINIARSLMIVHARRSARKYYVGPDTFANIEEAEGIEALKNPEDLTIVKVSDYDKPPKPIDSANMDASIYQNIYQSRIDFNEVSTSTEAQRGLSEKRKTKGESEAQEFHGAVRRTDKQSLVADFIAEVYKKLAILMQKTLTLPQAVKIQGKDGIFWSQVTNTDIQGEFHYEVEVSDLRPQIPEVEKAELIEFINALGNVINYIGSSPILPLIFNIQGLVKEFSKSYPFINVENILNMQVTPEQISQLAMTQLLQQNTQNNTQNNAQNNAQNNQG